MGICYLLFHVYPEAHWAVLETEIINKYPVAFKLFFCLYIFLTSAFHQFLSFALACCSVALCFCFLIPSNSPVLHGSVSRL